MEKRLPYLEITEKDEVIYLGYPLRLTVGEYQVFRAVFSACRYVDKKGILEGAPDNARLSAGSIPVHVASINKKAYRLGGRRLIYYKRGQGYYIGDEI